jgi:spore maturation protein CgeB
MECCVVSHPYKGLEKWFKKEKEIFVIENAEEAIEVYDWLRGEDEIRLKIGKAARERVLKEHTFKQRAKDIYEIIHKCN